MSSEKDKKFVVFIDSLSPDDLSRTSRFKETMQGKLYSPPPRVTPSVMSEIYTGEGAGVNGMARIHSQGDDPTRPQYTTIMETASATDNDVLSIGMPYSGPIRFLHNGSAMFTTSPGGQAFFYPNNASQRLNIPGPSGDLISENRHDITFDHYVDYTSQLFETARTLSVDFDIIFISHRLIDSYTHFQYDCGEDGRYTDIGERYRDKLAEVLDLQIRQLEPRGDVMWFSDHGATNKEKTFRINKWLRDKGYLSYDIKDEFVEKAREYGVLPGEEHPIDARVENQITPGHPAVIVDEDKTDAISYDAYDSCITTSDDSNEREIMRDLNDTKYIRSISHKSERYNTSSEYYEDLPDIIPDRDEGVFVSGNIHKDPIGMGWYRTGVHDRWGCYGSTKELDVNRIVSPMKMYEIIADFINVDTSTPPIEMEKVRLMTNEQKEKLIGEITNE